MCRLTLSEPVFHDIDSPYRSNESPREAQSPRRECIPSSRTTYNLSRCLQLKGGTSLAQPIVLAS
ncbi:hypothetical protein FA13DRAFT_1736628 [Coprinellus micaceus]|uniref:Uncharacterized protein n=1 Tax=Coprinellus micaceus TaxID=71717 RepID=A0A4Y7SZE2_COPMI|nr:hypothetical protein FA13DRAFT_1736628 [Coprinellus micaceus]